MQQMMCLTPRQNQDFRLLLRVCQRSLIAIEGFGCPWVAELMPLYTTWPGLLDALLAVAAQVRSRRRRQSTPSPSAASLGFDGPSPTSNLYHQTLTHVRALLTDEVSAGDHGFDGILAAVASAVILVIMSLGEPDGDWQHHAQQTIHLIDSSVLEQFTTASPLSRLLLTMVAHCDIPGFSLGRTAPLTLAWSRWNIEDLPRPTDTPFTEFEVISGIPLSLTSLISRLSEYAEKRRALTNPGTWQQPQQPSHDGGRNLADKVFLQTLIDLWEPPLLPDTLPGHQKLALLAAWKCTQRAARLYHMRGHGFYSNLLQPIAGISEHTYLSTLQDLVVGISYLMGAFNQTGSCIANSMAWSIAVLGSECGSRITAHLQNRVVQIIHSVAETFLMSHLHRLLLVLQDLWLRQAVHENRNPDRSEHLSLEMLAREHGLCIPLL
ncbi:hypothetical protein S40293_11235 [Stachybotrys chartarum IBT 40293]|nr:hypothetical protein S40293_11235 [Stachybotrys chartarum IBT 40293]